MQLARALAVSATTAVLVLALAGAAGALSSIGATPSAITATSTGTTFSGSFGTISCPLTLRGTLQSRVAKVLGATAGTITSATWGSSGSCVSGARSPVPTFTPPWTLTYNAFAGTLPNITSVDWVIQLMTFLISLFNGSCSASYQGNLTVRTSGSPVTALSANNSIGGNTFSRIAALSGLCPATATFSTTMTVTPSITLSLV